MTVEELKIAAYELGYNIIKRQEKFEPCICGNNRRKIFWKDGHRGLRCRKCGIEVIQLSDKRYDETEAAMKRLWNKTIREMKEKMNESN